MKRRLSKYELERLKSNVGNKRFTRAKLLSRKQLIYFIDLLIDEYEWENVCDCKFCKHIDNTSKSSPCENCCNNFNSNFELAIEED